MSDDLISRQAAIEAMRELPHEYNTKEQRARTGGIAACQTIIRELPSVHPKTGQWVYSERVQKIVYSYPTLCRVWERYKTATNEFERINYRCRIYEMSHLLADIGVISEQERLEMCDQVRGEFL